MKMTEEELMELLDGGKCIKLITGQQLQCRDEEPLILSCRECGLEGIQNYLKE